MTTPSLYEMTGIDLALYKPAIVVGTSYVPRGSPVDVQLRDRVLSYMHTISAFGGFDSASISLPIDLEEAGDWLGYIGYHLGAYDGGGPPIWAGFVNAVSVVVGPMSIQRGPLIDIGNRVEIVYSTVDISTDPPTVGVRARTAQANDTVSQAKYGIIHKVISMGGTTVTDAEQIRDTWLADNALPTTGQQYSGGMGSGEAMATLECLGYVHWSKLYPYNQTTTTGTMDLDAKIQAVLGADPNGLFSANYAYIAANTLQVKQWEDTDSTAFAVVQALTAMGDASDNRHLFGVYEDQIAHYEQAPTSVEYEQSILRQDQRVRQGGVHIAPWQVRPGKWLVYTDTDIGEPVGAPGGDDSRYEFIESVTYTAPYGLQHYGGKVATLPQMLARLGLGGAAS